MLKGRDEKLAVAQEAQADLIRKHRELDDARRELALTIEKGVQEELRRCGLKPGVKRKKGSSSR